MLCKFTKEIDKKKLPALLFYKYYRIQLYSLFQRFFNRSILRFLALCFYICSMLKVNKFTFNFFRENTYVVFDTDTRDAVIIDPGNYTLSEDEILFGFIQDEGLRINRLLLTHAHIDHLLGNEAVHSALGLIPELHPDDLHTFTTTLSHDEMFGVDLKNTPRPSLSLHEGMRIEVGKHILEVLFTPGHSSGSVSFYHAEQPFIISGDVIFMESIGRTDLPGGNLQTLLQTITDKVYTLPPQTIIYSGHGDETTVAYESAHNPFVRKSTA